MSIVDDLPTKSPVMSRVWRGIIATTATAVTQKVFIVLPDMSRDLKWGPCKWMPRVYPQTVDVSEGSDSAGDTEPSHPITIPHILMPVKGNDCLVLFDNNREPWIISWWPYA